MVRSLMILPENFDFESIFYKFHQKNGFSCGKRNKYLMDSLKGEKLIYSMQKEMWVCAIAPQHVKCL